VVLFKLEGANCRVIAIVMNIAVLSIRHTPAYSAAIDTCLTTRIIWIVGKRTDSVQEKASLWAGNTDILFK
jgi:hypothetical protein